MWVCALFALPFTSLCLYHSHSRCLSLLFLCFSLLFLCFFSLRLTCWFFMRVTQEVLRMVAKKEGYTEEEVQDDLAVLNGKRVRTVGDLRVLSKERIETLELPPVVTEYMQRVKAGGEQ